MKLWHWTSYNRPHPYTERAKDAAERTLISLGETALMIESTDKRYASQKVCTTVLSWSLRSHLTQLLGLSYCVHRLWNSQPWRVSPSHAIRNHAVQDDLQWKRSWFPGGVWTFGRQEVINCNFQFRPHVTPISICCFDACYSVPTYCFRNCPVYKSKPDMATKHHYYCV